MNSNDAFGLPADYPRALIRLAKSLQPVIISAGVSPSQASLLSGAIVEHLRSRYGGGPLYIPRGASYQNRLREEELFAAFKGNNIAELSRSYRMSQTRVRDIIKAARKRRCSPESQHSLF